MRGIEEHRHGRYYLRYRPTAGAETEFWANLERHAPHFDFKKGIVGVLQTPETPA